MNKILLTGRLTHDPELKTSANGVELCNFSLAVNRRFKNKETGKYEADFLPCVAWRQTAAFLVRYCHKGDMIAIEGSLQTRKYDEKDTGKKRTAFDVMVDNIEFCGGKREQGAAGQVDHGIPSSAPAPTSYTPSGDDDLPF